MSIPALIEVYDEMRRLAIAGSAVACGDFRLKKLIPTLEKSGERAPVFAKVAQAAQAVVDSNEKTASAALLDLTTLINAILYTQGETGITGELKPLETTNLGEQSTQTGARVLKPLLEALSTTGSGRLELIRDAYERGTFKDLRLVKPALNAIDDSYSEIGQFMAEKVLPLYGKAILPELRAKFDVKGKGGHVLRLGLMHHLDPHGSHDLVQLALSDGSKEMKVAAVQCLGTADEDLNYLLEQSRAKAKDVRAAALRAMTTSGISAGDAVGTLKKAIAGDDLELIVAHVNRSPLPEIHEHILEQAEKQLSETLKCKDSKLQGPAVARMQQLLMCLEGRTDAKSELFLLRCFDQVPAFMAIKSEPSGADLNELIAHLLSQGTPKMQKRLVAGQDTLSGEMLAYAISAARSTMEPAEFYNQFSPKLKGFAEKRSKKNSESFDRAETLLRVLRADVEHRYYSRWMAQPIRAESFELLDPRWLDVAVEVKCLPLVCQLARPNHVAIQQYLSEEFVKLKAPHEGQHVIQTMISIGHPQAADALIELIKKQAKGAHYFYYSYWYGRMIAELPKSTLPKFEALLPTLPEKMVDQLLESVIALKNKPE